MFSKAFYYVFCIGGMIGFWFLCRFLITGISAEFGYGVATGATFWVILLWLGEKAGAFKLVELDKGTWIPHD